MSKYKIYYSVECNLDVEADSEYDAIQVLVNMPEPAVRQMVMDSYRENGIDIYCAETDDEKDTEGSTI